MKTATIRIRKDLNAALADLRRKFLNTWDSGKYQGEFFEFESPAALFRAITPKRWELIEALQSQGAMSIRALSRTLHRDVKRVHEDTHALIRVGLIEKNPEGKIFVPFEEIRADFVIHAAA
ncbi:MAG: transcriptional regulator [Ferrovum myxofaciens]|uniref:HVO_A0114 family putative DNA-binding protein n=1 Tax=Ferrovum myxofaciens TaxID=416213 RepID=UPI002357A160|nr:hypothetical protein [Ferrovum myxofaciens]QKE40484.1 MAG: transcriptional regulator [Ferrovum myxofaciens]